MWSIVENITKYVPYFSGNKYAGGNPVCPRPTPEWQKGIAGEILIEAIGSFFMSNTYTRRFEQFVKFGRGALIKGGTVPLIDIVI